VTQDSKRSPDSGSADDTHRASLPPGWWGLLVRAALLPTLVTLPLVNLPLRADHRFNTFHFGGDLSQHPWHLVSDPVRDVPRLLGAGNFRPLGRMLERGQEWLTFELATGLNLPATIAIRVVALLFVALLGVALVVLAEAVTSTTAIFATRPSGVAQLTSLALPVLLVATTESAVVLFTSLYFASAVVVLLTALAVVRRSWMTEGRASLWLLAAAALGGGCLASFNEVGYLAPPLAVIAVAARGVLTLGLAPSVLVRTVAVKVLAALVAGFLAVFVPVRVLIARECADGECYSASDLALGPDFFPALVNRLLSVNPGAMWSAAEVTRDPGDVVRDLTALLTLVVLVVAAVITWREVRRSRPMAPRGLAALALVGGGLLIVPSTMMALSSYVQDRVSTESWALGEGYRDAPLTAAALTLLGVAACWYVIELLGSTARTAGLIGLVTLVTAAAFVTSQVNVGFASLQRPSAAADLFDRISLAMLHLDERSEDQQCALLAEFDQRYPDRLDWQARLRRATNAASFAVHGRPFCPEEQQ